MILPKMLILIFIDHKTLPAVKTFMCCTLQVGQAGIWPHVTYTWCAACSGVMMSSGQTSAGGSHDPDFKFIQVPSTTIF